MWFIALSLGSTPAAWALPDGCERPSSVVQLKGAALRGEEAFADLDVGALGEAHSDAINALPCLGEAIAPGDIAAFHRLMGMQAFVLKEPERVLTEFHAARKLVPGYQVPESVAPEGHPLIEAYNQAALADEGALEQPYPPIGGYVTVGGVRGAPRPSASPVVLQVFSSRDEVQETLYLQPGDVMPQLSAPPPTQVDNAQRVPLVIATASTLLASGGMLAVARVYEEQFLDPNTAVAELEDLRTQTNAFGYGAFGMGVLTIGLGTITVVTW